MRTLLGRLAAVTLAAALVGCTGTGRNASLAGAGLTAGAPKPAAPKPAAAARARAGAAPANPYAAQVLTPVPARAGGLRAAPGKVSAFVAVDAPSSLTGTATFLDVDAPFFADSAAGYRLRALGGAKNALVTLSTLDEDLFTDGGAVVTATTDATGAFSLGGAPADRPFVLNVGFARGHRLTAIVPAGAAAADADEATSMVAEMARWQLFPFARPDDPDVTDLDAPTLDGLAADTRALLATLHLPVTAGDVPSIEALRTGAGFVLRNLYVEAFGGAVTAAGGGTADALSDAWRAVLGFRPLALTRVAGNGIRGYNQSDGLDARETQIVGPSDAVADARGHVYLSLSETSQIALVPKTSLAGPLFGEDDTTLAAGTLHTIGGVVNGATSPIDWELGYRDAAATDVTNPDVPAPPLAGGFPLYTPEKLVVEEPAAGPAVAHLYHTSGFAQRVMFMPAGTVAHFGHSYRKDRLYTVAGVGVRTFDDNGDPVQVDGVTPWVAAADGMAATDAGLLFPTGLARDAAGNLWILDAGDGGADTGAVYVVREADGTIWQVPLTRGGAPYHPDGALDLRLSPDGSRVLVADTNRHWVFDFAAPTAGAIAGWTVGGGPADAAITRVVGKQDVAGFLDTSLPDVLYPDIHDVSDGLDDPDGDADPADVVGLLNRPGSICFAAGGGLVVGDTGNGRLRLREGGRLYTIAGGLDTKYVTGDARLAYLPAIGYVNADPDGNLLVTDRKEAVVRRLHAARGIR